MALPPRSRPSETGVLRCEERPGNAGRFGGADPRIAVPAKRPCHLTAETPISGKPRPTRWRTTRRGEDAQAVAAVEGVRGAGHELYRYAPPPVLLRQRVAGVDLKNPWEGSIGYPEGDEKLQARHGEGAQGRADLRDYRALVAVDDPELTARRQVLLGGAQEVPAAELAPSLRPACSGTAPVPILNHPGFVSRSKEDYWPSPVLPARALRYSATTSSVSSSTEVSATGLSYSMRPLRRRFTRSQTSKTWA